MAERECQIAVEAVDQNLESALKSRESAAFERIGCQIGGETIGGVEAKRRHHWDQTQTLKNHEPQNLYSSPHKQTPRA
jgi:hypothetical protein